MAKLKSTVLKQMTPEQMADIQAIQGICGEILGSNPVEAAPEPPNTPQDAEKAANPMSEQLRKMADEIDKSEDPPPNPNEVEKASQGPTANESGEERLSTSTQTNDANMSEVGKALLQMVKKSQGNVHPVQPQGANPADVATLVVQGLAPVLKSMQEKQSAQDAALLNMFDAIGVSESVLKSLETPIPKTPTQNPVTSQDAGLFFAEMMGVMKSQMGTQQNSEPVNRLRGYGDIETLQKSQQKTRTDMLSAMETVLPGFKIPKGQ